MDDVNRKRTKTQKLLEDICLYTKACQGYIYGSVIREHSYRNSINLEEVNVRIDLHLLSTFAQVLGVTYSVVSLPLVISNYTCFSKQFVVSCKDDSEVRIIVNVSLLAENEWHRLPSVFDVDVLAENSNKHFIRANYVQLERFPDKLSHIKKRILDGRFALLDSSACRSSEDLTDVIHSAACMVAQGWIMDDLVYGDSTWIVNTWKDIKTQPKECRKSHSRHNLALMTSLNECALCHEQFADEDVVINTKCNHNFHWHDGTCKGLCEWLMRGNTTCPVCRKNAV